ncbi:hypothetical protein F5148DRAFT_222992 [Russula earlei]|uniref:Uncharacterized protein n=1 Tax=Russula earlei TaxID=71964 RepID=A0ACC0U3Z1_9AGAM|nr:hypothetical protein F5148DRAFT_222992 [Russula earlei]
MIIIYYTFIPAPLDPHRLARSYRYRFVDEFRNFTYAAYGKAILRQPGGFAFQIFDSRAEGWLRKEEYRDGVVTKIRANSIEGLAQILVPHVLWMSTHSFGRLQLVPMHCRRQENNILLETPRMNYI